MKLQPRKFVKKIGSKILRATTKKIPKKPKSIVGKVLRKAAPIAVKTAKNIGKEIGGKYIDTAIRGAGMAGSAYLGGNPLPMMASEFLVQKKGDIANKVFGAIGSKFSDNSAHESYSPKKTKPIDRNHFRNPEGAPQHFQRREEMGMMRRPHPRAVSKRNSSHLYSFGHPTGGKI